MYKINSSGGLLYLIVRYLSGQKVWISTPGVYRLNQSINSSSTCIRIESSDVIFDGQGYSIDGPDSGTNYGVYVYNNSTTLTNVTVRNVTVTDWNIGIYYNNADNGSITNNTANSNSFGIFLASSSNYNTITDNTASNNWGYGIYLKSSGNNTITNNTANSNYNDMGAYGIYLESSSNNILTNNIANSNTFEGIVLYLSSNNTITNNNASNNYFGIVLDSSSNNTIYNNFFNNTVNIYFTGTVYTNTWNTTKTLSTNIIGGPWIGGNYWAKPDGTGFSDICTDANTNGICDSNHTLTSGNIDYLPLSLNFTNDTTPPTGNITINGGAASTNSTTVTLTLPCSDTNGCSKMQFSNNGTNYTQPEPYNATKQWNLTSGDGQKTVYVKYIDSVGNNMTAPVNDTIILDTPPYQIDLNSPQNNTNTTATVDFNWTAYDSLSSIMTCNLTIDGKVNVSDINTTNETATNYTVNGLKDGTYNWSVTCRDNASTYNVNTSETYSFTVDAIPPQITITRPTNDTLASDDFTFTFTDDAGISCAWYQTNSSGINVTNCTISDNTWSGTFTGLSNGQRNVTVWANDTLGNENSTTRYWTRNTGSPLINITSPLNKTYLKRGMDYNLTNYGTVLSNSVNCSVDGNADFSMANATNRTYYNLSKAHPQLAEGQHDLTCHSNPAFNNTVDATRWFNIGIPPVIENFSLSATTIYEKETITLTIDSQDASFNGSPENTISSVIATLKDPNSDSNNKTCSNTGGMIYSCSWSGTKTDIVGEYFISYLYANDSLGNMNSTTTTLNFTVLEGERPPDDPTGPGNGGGGGGGGGGSSCNTFTFTRISKGENKTASFKGKECKNFPHVSIIPKENLSYAKLTVNLYDKKPWNTMSDPPEEAYSYLYLRFSKPDTYIEKGIIEFSINSTWLKENDVDPYNVTVYRFVDNNWTGIETSPVLDNETNIIFSAVTPGFSYFAITGRLESGFRGLISKEKAEPEETPVEPPPTPAPTPVVPAFENETENETSDIGIYNYERDENPPVEKPSIIGRIFSFIKNGLPMLATLAVIAGVFSFAVRIREKKRRAVREKEMLEDLDELVKYREELEKEMLEMVRLKKLGKLK